MNLRQKSVRKEHNNHSSSKVIVVAVKASIEIVPKTPLVWALTHVAQHGDTIKLLLVLPSFPSGRGLWSLSSFTSECTHLRPNLGTSLDQKDDIADMCNKMMLELHDVYDPNKISIKIKIVAGSPSGVVAAEVRRARSNWVILDRKLKCEKKCCMEELQCNVVVMKRSEAKVLRLNLVESSYSMPEQADQFQIELRSANAVCGPPVTPTSSPDEGTPGTTTTAGTSSISSCDPWASPFLVSEVSKKFIRSFNSEENWTFEESDLEDSGSENLSIHSFYRHVSKYLKKMSSQRSQDKALVLNRDSLMGRGTNVREVTALSRNAASPSPPLCSICQHKTPMFGKPPKLFTYTELELATKRFSQENFLAEGGFGSVHRGVLPDGQVIAVKQHKLASSQGDVEFCSEVEVLSCAQHRNVVMLIGFCVEFGRRLLVYEYICNGSLDSHLYGKDRHPLKWPARQKIAVGAARGLRYLHEECRVGCIVHRDMRPNNILITHDFEPLVGDFGLARWQPDGHAGVDTRVIGSFGYLSPEYAQSGQITEKADVYSFGVILVELITGRKAMELNRPKGQQCLTEWARPLLEQCAIAEMIDPRLRNCYSEQEACNMVDCASLCIRRDPHSRPRMSQVLRLLEGDVFINSINYSSDNLGSTSSRMRVKEQSLQQQHCHNNGPALSEPKAENSNRKLTYKSQRTRRSRIGEEAVQSLRKDY